MDIEVSVYTSAIYFLRELQKQMYVQRSPPQKRTQEKYQIFFLFYKRESCRKKIWELLL